MGYVFKFISFIIIVFYLTSCQSMYLKYRMNGKLKENVMNDKKECVVTYEYADNYKLNAIIPALCIFTGAIYGGTCWIYAAMPFQSQKKAFKEQAKKKMDKKIPHDKYKIDNENVYFINWDKGYKKEDYKICPVEKTVKRKVPFSGSSENEFFRVELLPIYQKLNIYIFDKVLPNTFILKIINKTEKDLTIDWNNTFYIEDSQTRSTFMFEGIKYSEKNYLKSPDVIFAKSSFTKIIYPVILVNFKTSGYGQYSSSSWVHENIPLAGTTGAYLSLKIDNHTYNTKILLVGSEVEVEEVIQENYKLPSSPSSL